MLISGSCHCNNISFALTWEPDPTEIPARACTCSFCRKHGGVWTSNPGGALKIAVRDSNRLSRYTFGTGTAAFHVCMTCGVVPVATSAIDGRLYAVVNVSCFEHVERSLVRRTTESLEAETTAARLARRRRNWIASVEYVAGRDAPRHA